MSRFSASCLASRAAAFRGIRAGHGDAQDIFAPKRGDGDGSDHRRIDAAAQTDDNFPKSRFAHVVARAANERLKRDCEFIGRLCVQVSRAGFRVENYQVFGEGTGLRGDSCRRARTTTLSPSNTRLSLPPT